MSSRVRRRAGWSVLGVALLALIWGLGGLIFLGDAGSGPQTVETGTVEGVPLLPGLAETAFSFGSPLEEPRDADATPFSDAFQLDADLGGHPAWADHGQIVPATFPNVPLPVGIEPDFGQASEPPAGDTMLAALGESADGVGGLVPNSLGSFIGTGASSPNGPVGGGAPGDEPRLAGLGDDPNGPQVPEPSPVDLLQIALALLAGLAYRRFRA